MAAPHDAPAAGGGGDDTTADDDAAAAAALPSDTLAALQLLRAQFPTAPGCASLPRLALVSQVYALVADRTAADRALSSLVAAGTLRRFRLCTGRDEYALMFADEYNSLVAAAAAEAGGSGGGSAVAFDAIARRVLPACRGVAVATPELRRLLRGGEGGKDAPLLSERAVDDAVAALMQAGLLTRATETGAGALLFTAPNAVRLCRVATVLSCVCVLSR